MSASNKKKLRRQDASLLTEKQLAELAEEKKTRAYTIGFVVVIALLVAVALFIMGSSIITGSGILEKKTVAATVDNHDISNAELSYYYVDAVNNFYQDLSQNYGSNANMYSQLFYGLDLSKSLDSQQVSEEATWADYFIQEALSSARSTYALCDAAAAEGVALNEEEIASIDAQATYLTTYAAANNYSKLGDFLKVIYGNGATEESYRNYTMMNTLASKYFGEHANSLTYTDGDLRAKEAENYNYYTSYTANYYYLNSSPFLTGGTTDENGTTTYSDEEKAASLEAAKAAADALAAGKYDSLEAFDTGIAAMPHLADAETVPTSTAIDHQLYPNLSTLMQEWLSDASRKTGDVTVIANESTDSEGNTTVSGYYVMYFVSADENKTPITNVRHLLVAFEGGTLDENGKKIYSDSEKSAAKLKAEKLLNQWKSGEATEESFAALVTENTDDTASAENGGLYEMINADSSYVENFLNWAVDPSHQVGDTGIVETEYGCHIMYLSAISELNYRDTMITNTLKTEDMQEWYSGILDAVAYTEKDTSRMNRDLTLNING